EREIMDRNTALIAPSVSRVVTLQDILKAREVLRSIYVDEKVKEYARADAYGKDAVKAVALAKAWTGG
ncbi:MAG: hypothetical protein MUQ56_04595, partial [Thermoleophilia bacterium]|nr:hypothetical protein [Thermoleophilia bacterium]